jgi:hypothetical protein
LDSVVYDAEKRLIVIEIRGRIDKALVQNLASQVAGFSKEHNCFHVLNDAREATIFLSTLEIYSLPRTIMEILSATGVDVRKFKRALVFSKNVDDFTFFETVSRNRGQNVKLFRNIDEAVSWLLKKKG